jgi:hypothetical protein
VKSGNQVCLSPRTPCGNGNSSDNNASASD